MTGWEFTGWAALAGLLCLDAVYVGQFMISRPIVVGLLFGRWLGMPEIGAFIGAALELVWIAPFPMKGRFSPDPTLAAALPLLWAFFVPEKWDMNDLAAAGHPKTAAIYLLPLAVFAAWLAKWVDLKSRSLTLLLLRRVEGEIHQDRYGLLHWSVPAMAAFHAIRSVAMAILLAWAGALLLRYMGQALPALDFLGRREMVYAAFLGISGAFFTACGLCWGYFRRV